MQQQQKSSVDKPDLDPPVVFLKPPIIIRKGPRGYGFTLKAIRVYNNRDSNYYTLQHLVVVSTFLWLHFESNTYL